MGETGRSVTEVLGPAAREQAAVPPQKVPPTERYIVLGEIGRGGMGVVHRAYDQLLCREVALKSVTIDLALPETSSWIVDEARAMAMLNHPNVVAVYDVNVSGGGVVLVMEYVPGTTLARWLKQQRRDPRSILRTFMEAGRGLAAAHATGLLHRDFKPANVLIDEEGRVRVTDFGLACVAGTVDEREVLSREVDANRFLGGTPRYMAPEQHLLEPLSVATDQYAFCLALWEALTGRDVFSRGDATDVAEKLAGPPPWPREVSVSPRVSEALRRGLAPNAADR